MAYVFEAPCTRFRGPWHTFSRPLANVCEAGATRLSGDFGKWGTPFLKMGNAVCENGERRLLKWGAPFVKIGNAVFENGGIAFGASVLWGVPVWNTFLRPLIYVFEATDLRF